MSSRNARSTPTQSESLMLAASCDRFGLATNSGSLRCHLARRGARARVMGADHPTSRCFLTRPQSLCSLTCRVAAMAVWPLSIRDPTDPVLWPRVTFRYYAPYPHPSLPFTAANATRSRPGTRTTNTRRRTGRITASAPALISAKGEWR